MARNVENDKGFLVIEVTMSEVANVFGGLGICDACNKNAALGFYVAVLNQWFCPACYEEWYNRAKYYQEDASIERKNYEFYSKRLKL